MIKKQMNDIEIKAKLVSIAPNPHLTSNEEQKQRSILYSQDGKQFPINLLIKAQSQNTSI